MIIANKIKTALIFLALLTNANSNTINDGLATAESVQIKIGKLGKGVKELAKMLGVDILIDVTLDGVSKQFSRLVKLAENKDKDGLNKLAARINLAELIKISGTLNIYPPLRDIKGGVM